MTNAIYKKWKDQYLNLINKAIKKFGWTKSDCNPWFYIVYDHLHRSNADSLREFKRKLKEVRHNANRN